jgi:hypothetical protein
MGALGLNILVGYCGQISLGTAAFMAVGAYAAFNFQARFENMPLLIALIGGGLCAMVVGVVFGLPSLRIRGLYLAVATLAGLPGLGHAATPTLRVLTHASFDVPKELLSGFEKSAGVKLSIVKAGDAGEMLNKLILTRANPIADVVFGLDNALAAKALAAGVLATYSGPAASAPPRSARRAG